MDLGRIILRLGVAALLPITALLLLVGLFASSCTHYQSDRMYISDQKYEVAKKLYDRTDSLLLTEQGLQEMHWQDGEINEAIYRLKKQHRLEKPAE